MSKTKKNINARTVVVEAILLATTSSVPLPQILQDFFNRYFSSDEKNSSQRFYKENKAFCTQLAYAYFRMGGLLRLPLQGLLHNKKNLAPRCEISLILALYEILCLAKESDDHAILFEYVDDIKGHLGQGSANLVNGVLRNALRQKEELAELLRNAEEALNAPVASNQIPSKKQLRKDHALANIPPLFSDEMRAPTLKNIMQDVVKNSFYAPIPAYRISVQDEKMSDELKEISAKQGMEYLYPHGFFLVEQTKNQENSSNQEIRAKINSYEKEGFLTRQGVASQLFVQKIKTYLQNPSLSQNLSPKRIWDACCGRGGKSLALLEEQAMLGNSAINNTHNHGLVLCSDPNKTRLEQAMQKAEFLAYKNSCNGGELPLYVNLSLQEVAEYIRINRDDLNSSYEYSKIEKYILHSQKKGSTEPHLIQGDSQEKTRTILEALREEKCSHIILDSPCSTSGTIARNPEVKQRITKESLSQICAVQKELLVKAWDCLRPEGYLFYCTCSVFYKENEEQIQNFMNSETVKNSGGATLLEQGYINPFAINPLLKGHDILFYAILQKI